jgi:hypothetical protein
MATSAKKRAMENIAWARRMVDNLSANEARKAEIISRVAEIDAALPIAFATGTGSSAAPLRTERAALVKELKNVEDHIRNAPMSQKYLDSWNGIEP